MDLRDRKMQMALVAAACLAWWLLARKRDAVASANAGTDDGLARIMPWRPTAGAGQARPKPAKAPKPGRGPRPGPA